jgi:trehalose-6-phosphate synthase
LFWKFWKELRARHPDHADTISCANLFNPAEESPRLTSIRVSRVSREEIGKHARKINGQFEQTAISPSPEVHLIASVGKHWRVSIDGTAGTVRLCGSCAQ